VALGVELWEQAQTLDDAYSATYRRFMGNPRSNARALGLISIALLVTGAVAGWVFRRRWTDHDVSDPGVTL
jgi:hypothetical protein